MMFQLLSFLCIRSLIFCFIVLSLVVSQVKTKPLSAFSSSVVNPNIFEFVVGPVALTYIIKDNVTDLNISCESSNPIIWTTRLSKAGGLPEASATFQMIKSFTPTTFLSPFPKYSEVKPPDSGYLSLLTLNRSDDITGLYSCDEFNKDGKRTQSDFYLYGGKTPTFLNAGKTFYMKTEFYDLPTYSKDHFHNQKEGLAIPCSTSYPTQDVFLDLTSANGVSYYNIKPTSHSWWDIAVHVSEYGDSFFRNGFTVICKLGNGTINFYDSEDIVVTIFQPSPEMLLQPPSEDILSLSVNTYDTFVFECKSIYPSEIVFANNGNTSSVKILSYKYKEEDPEVYYYSYIYTMEIRMPGHWYGAESLTLECRNLHNKSNYGSWEYKFYHTSGDKLTEHRLTHGISSDSLRCFSKAIETLKINKASCQTFTECQMVASTLYESKDTSIDEADFEEIDTYQRFIEFRLDKLKFFAGYIVRCHDFETDVSQIVYPDYIEIEYSTGIGESLIILGEPEEVAFKSLTPLILFEQKNVNKEEKREEIQESNDADAHEPEFYMHELINLTCSSSQMITITEPIWSVSYKNNTESIIKAEDKDVQYLGVKLNGNYIESTLRFRVFNEDIIGIKCKVVKIAEASSHEWRSGLPFKNGETVKVIEKENYKPLMIRQKEKMIEYQAKLAPVLLTAIITGGLALMFVIVLIIHNRRKLKETIMLTKEECEKMLTGSDFQDCGVCNENVQLGPYDKRFDVSRDKFLVNFSERLGRGEFGEVYSGLLNQEKVAVKTLKRGGNKEQLFALWSEAKLMIYANAHENVVKLLGAYTTEIQKGKLFIFIELCEFKSLEKYLRLNQKFYRPENASNKVAIYYNVAVSDSESIKDNASMESNDELQGRQQYVKFDYLEKNDPNILKFKDLLNWGYQIASGMNYLSQKQIIHRDLAARNILVKDKHTVKITDFGLAKQLLKYNFYQDKKRKFAWQWQPPEALLKDTFSVESDIWSFGVTLWEIFTFGIDPWAEYEYGVEFLEDLMQGERMHKPEYATIEIYELMLNTWNEDPKDRPNFPQIMTDLEYMKNQLKL